MFNLQNKNLGGLRFGVDGDGNGGYYKADDSFVPFKSGIDNLLTVITSSLGSYTSTKKQKLLIVGTVMARGIDSAPKPSFSFTKNNSTISTSDIALSQTSYQHGGCYHYINVTTKIAIVDAVVGDVFKASVATGTQYKIYVYELT